MAHARTQIRDAYVAYLTGLPATGSNVFGSRMHPLPKGTTAALRISIPSDDSETVTMDGLQLREPRFVVEAVVVGKHADVDDLVDQVCAEVEAKMDSFPAGLEVKSAVLVETNIEFDGKGGEAIASAEMVYEMKYNTREGAPEVLL